MANITSVKAIQILDSRGLPTVSCRVETDDGLSAVSKVPSGASTGEREALELRDGGNEYLGKGVLKAVKNINTKLADVLIGMDARNQFEIDQALIDLDGTPAKKNLGANAILAASIATLRSGAKSAKLPLYEHVNNLYCSKFKANKQLSLPVPMLNIINGGEHANNNIDIQEFMIMPIGAASFNECMQWAIEIYGALKSLLASKGLSTAVGDEGGFAPDLKSNHEAIELILKSIEDCGLEAGKDIVLALDCAASEFFTDGKYVLKGENKSLDSNDFVDYLKSLVSSYPIRSIEDGMDENDFDGWSMLTNELGNSIQIVGDDLFVTNVKDLQHGIDKSLANSILIKLNQIGTVGETLEAINLASQNNYSAVISHRSGETEDNTIADICVGVSAGQIKTGAPCRSDRTSKYNRLLWIESDLGNSVSYANEVFL